MTMPSKELWENMLKKFAFEEPDRLNSVRKCSRGMKESTLAD